MSKEEAANKPGHGRFYAILLLVVAAINIPLLDGRRMIGWDSYDYFYPKFLYLADCLRSGIFPLWNPYELSGVPFIPWNGAFLNPLNLLFVLLAAVFKPLYVFQAMLVAPAFAGGAGAYFLFSSFNYSRRAAYFGAFAFTITMFGALLGQYSIAYAIAFIPWTLYILTDVIASRGRISGLRLLLYSLAVYSFVVGAYPVFIFLIFALAAAFGGYRLAREPALRARKTLLSIAGTLALIVFLGGLLSSVVVLPMLENRAFVARGLAGDLVSPDPRVRMFLSKTDPVVGFESTAQNYFKAFVKHVPWHSASGLAVFCLLLFGLRAFFRDSFVRFLLILAVPFLLYAKGRGGAVYDLVYNYVPVFGNNRFPLLGFSLAKFLVIFLAVHYLDRLLGLGKEGAGAGREISWFKAAGYVGLVSLPAAFFYPGLLPFSAALVIFSGLAYLFLRGRITALAFLTVLTVSLLAQVYASRPSPSYVKKSAEAAQQTSARRTTPEYDRNYRRLRASADYLFDDKSWIYGKVPQNQGYYMADPVQYWYLKNRPALGRLVYTAENIKPRDMSVKREAFATDNAFIDALVAQVPGDSADFTLADVPPPAVPAGAGSGKALKKPGFQLRGFSVLPNRIKADIQMLSPALLVLTDKNYPGWKVYVDGAEKEIVNTDLCFKGVYLDAGRHAVEFVFRPRSFFIGLALSLVTLLGLLLWLVWPRLLRAFPRRGPAAR